MTLGEIVAVGVAICFAIALCLAVIVLGVFAVHLARDWHRKRRRVRAASGPAPADLAGRVPLSAGERLAWREFLTREEDLSETGRQR